MTLLPVLALLSVLAALALAASLSWIRYYDLVNRQNEKVALADIRRTLRLQVMDATGIPRPAEVLPAVALRSRRSAAQVEFNRQHNPRVVLADPGLGVGPLGFEGLPYSQGMTGAVPPRNPRLLLLSSLGEDLPTNVVTGAVLAPSQFSNLWMTAQGQAPADWNWSGNANDLCIQQVHLGDLFVKVTLRYYADQPQHRGGYTIDRQQTTTNGPSLLPTTSFSPHLIRGTYLSLYGTNGVLQFRDIVQDDDIIYTCHQGVWHRGMGNLGSRVGPVIRHPTPEEFADCLTAFTSPETQLWSNNSGSTKADMVAAITDFLTAGAYNNQSQAMDDAQAALIDVWVDFTGASPNKP